MHIIVCAEVVFKKKGQNYIFKTIENMLELFVAIIISIFSEFKTPSPAPSRQPTSRALHRYIFP